MFDSWWSSIYILDPKNTTIEGYDYLAHAHEKHAFTKIHKPFWKNCKLVFPYNGFTNFKQRQKHFLFSLRKPLFRKTPPYIKVVLI